MSFVCCLQDGNGVVDATEGCVVVVGTEAGIASSLISSWHPPCPVVVVSSDDSVLRKTNAKFSLYPCKVEALGTAEDVANAGAAVLFSCIFVKRGCAQETHPCMDICLSFRLRSLLLSSPGMAYAKAGGFLEPGKRVLVVTGAGNSGSADASPVITVRQETSQRKLGQQVSMYTHPYKNSFVLSSQSLKITHDLVVGGQDSTRLAKTICTLGPKYAPVPTDRDTTVNSSHPCKALALFYINTSISC